MRLVCLFIDCSANLTRRCNKLQDELELLG